MHVLIIPSFYQSHFNPICAPFFRDQALALKNNGCEVGVICPLPISFERIWQRKSLNFNYESYSEKGIITIVSPFLSLPKTPNRVRRIRLKKGKQLFKKYINENGKPDIIHVHSFFVGELALWIKQKYNIPYVVTEHSSTFERKLLSISNIRLAKKVFENSHYNIAVSQSLSAAINYYFNKLDFQIIPNIVNTNFFNLKDKKEKKNLQFINIAHLNTNKNQFHLINSFTKAFKGNSYFKLLIVGHGPERNALEQQIKYHNMNSQIKLFGGASREEVKDLLHQSDYFVLTSKVETFGVVLIEAMSCGLPVLSTKCGGPESIITNDEVGILSDFDSFGENMALIYSKKYNPDTIRKYAVDHFSESVIAEKLIKIYNDELNSINA